MVLLRHYSLQSPSRLLRPQTPPTHSQRFGGVCLAHAPRPLSGPPLQHRTRPKRPPVQRRPQRVVCGARAPQTRRGPQSRHSGRVQPPQQLRRTPSAGERRGRRRKREGVQRSPLSPPQSRPSAAPPKRSRRGPRTCAACARGTAHGGRASGDGMGRSTSMSRRVRVDCRCSRCGPVHIRTVRIECDGHCRLCSR